MAKKIKIGYLEDGMTSIYLEKHSWDCDWYWGFGYLGNTRMHFHMDSMIVNESNGDHIVFDSISKLDVKLDPKIDGWKLMELFSRAYILKEYAEMRYTGSAHITSTEPNVENKEEAEKINKELGELLDYTWNWLEEVVKD